METLPILEDEMSDEDLIGYCDLHCETPRGLFNGRQIKRMYYLAGKPEEYEAAERISDQQWFPMHEEMKTLVNLSRELAKQKETLTQVNEIPMTWGDIMFRLDEYESGNDALKEYGGIPPNSALSNVSTNVLDCFVNVLDNSFGFVIGRWGVDDQTKLRNLVIPSAWYAKILADMVDKHSADSHTQLSAYGDDVVIFGSTENSYYVLWYSRCGRCDIVRVSNDSVDDLKSFASSYMTELANTYKHWQRCAYFPHPIFAPINTLKGHIRW